MSSPAVLFGMGNPLLDVLVFVDKAFLDKYGLKENDAILAEEKHMKIYEEVTSLSPLFCPGGATQNAINVAQWVLGVPGATLMTGCIKDDDFGRKLIAACQKNGVTTIYSFHQGDAPTGVCACLINGHNRSLVTNLGAANLFPAAHLEDPTIWNHVIDAKFFYSASFFLTSCPEALMKIAHHVAEHAGSKTLVLNLSAPFLCKFFFEPMMKAMPYVTVLFGNETEAQAFAESHGWDVKSIPEIAKNIADLPICPDLQNAGCKRLVIITQGSEPVVSIQTGDSAARQWPVERIPDELIVDTNGAGDAFVGGFLAQFTKGRPLEECVRCGIWASQVIIQHTGCTFPDVCEFK